LKDLRSNEDTNSIPVILHSTKILDEDERDFFQQRGVSIFPKQALTLPDSAIRIRELIDTLTAHSEVESKL
jgi:hypothetical protein